ncbi:GIY-YIG nuclease family protein [Thalassobaculum sp. OXR-137]|uniref:GIY-YIG nuclease family protein n=1 Tax=Thalassobaculum sp. OXR-137 TaxID=3100173 RepID=UPI002AC9A394|nr:GIY-YIG nuclease family protein [Thalassobaculum sp. OXR-137]WPZ32252.1 GIY-YIG nuclease family protein [Thalassobaculum sp. OXR-137]
MRAWVYILASRRNGTLYVGQTTDLARRIHQHRAKLLDGFTATYDVTRLVYLEELETLDQALLRERRLKRWRRDWKLDLIEKENPEWRDLSYDLIGPPPT